MIKNIDYIHLAKNYLNIVTLYCFIFTVSEETVSEILIELIKQPWKSGNGNFSNKFHFKIFASVAGRKYTYLFYIKYKSNN